MIQLAYRKVVSTLPICYSAGPGLFPRDLPDGRRETWEEAQARVRELNSIITQQPMFLAITPTNAGLERYEESFQARACLYKDLLCAVQSDITFADVTPFGGREPDAGTVVEATACALSGGLLVLWADPLTTFAEKYADADVHPDSSLDEHYNLMLEQLYRWSWQAHFGFSRPVFQSLAAAVAETATHVHTYGLQRTRLLGLLDQVAPMTSEALAIEALSRLYQ